jgi:hypothetical protein
VVARKGQNARGNLRLLACLLRLFVAQEAVAGGPPAMVYAVELGERHVYCSSPHCIAALVREGWRLSDHTQLTTLVQELTTGPATATHEPSDHLRSVELPSMKARAAPRS